MDELLRDFLSETAETLAEVDIDLARLAAAPGERPVLDRLLRQMHTVKGAASFMALSRIESLCHAAESCLARLRDRTAEAAPNAALLVAAAIDRLRALLAHIEVFGTEPAGDDDALVHVLEGGHAAPDSAGAVEAAPLVSALDPAARGAIWGAPSTRLSDDALDRLLAIAQELAAARDRLAALRAVAGFPDDGGALSRLSAIASALEDEVIRLRRQPIGLAWSALPRIIRDCARDLGKEIALELDGGDIEVDRLIVAKIRSPLVHLARNACDHGLESPQARQAAGKPAIGRVSARAVQDGDRLVITLADDGAGLDLAAIRARARASGVAGETELNAMTQAELSRLIFAPGLSTAGAVTRLSGRGVGLDAVRAGLEGIGAAVDVCSEPGQGTTFTITAPLAPEPGRPLGVGGTARAGLGAPLGLGAGR